MPVRRWFSVLGPLRAWRDGTEIDLGSAQQRAVLAALLLREGGQAGVEQLVDGLWSAAVPASAVTTVRTYVYRLRRVLGDGPDGTPAIRSRGGGYVMDLGDDELDLVAFRRHVATAEDARRVGDTASVAKQLADGLGLWSGSPLIGLPGPYAQHQRAYLDRLRAEADEARLRAELDLGGHARIVPELSALLAERPLDERLREMLMIALYRSGRQADALACYHEGRVRLADELGIDPGPSLRGVYDRVLHADPGLLAEPVPSSAVPEPAGPGIGDLPNRPRAFTGRWAQLDAADALLAEPGPRSGPVISLIVGTAGVGKTSFALHWAHRVAAGFPDGRIHLNLRGFDPGGSPLDVADAVRTLLLALGVSGEQLPAHPDAQLALYRSIVADRRLLLLLDNARDADQVRPLLAGGPECLIVVTSRAQLSGIVAAEGARVVHLDVLGETEAYEMLARQVGADRVAAEPRAVEDIIRSCARLPLALAMVAGRAAGHPDLRLADIAADLRAGQGSLDKFGSAEPSADARSVFSWSYAALSEPAARLFRMLSLHPGPQISLASAASIAALPADQAQRLLDELCDAVLLNEQAPGRYSWHDLLRAYAGETGTAVDPADEREAARRRLFDHYAHGTAVAARVLHPHRRRVEPPSTPRDVVVDAPAGYADAMAWTAAEHATLLAVTSLAAATGFHRHVWYLARAAEVYLVRSGHWHDWVRTQSLAVAAGEALDDLALQAWARHSLGRAYNRRRDFRPAGTHTMFALHAFRELGEREGEGACRVTLGTMASRQGRHAEAIDHYQAALDICEARGDALGIATAFNCLGYEYIRSGDHNRGIELCSRAMARCVESGDREGQAHAWDSIGLGHHRAGRFATAIACYRQAVSIFEDLGHHHQMATTLGFLGEACQSMGDRAGAVEAWRTAVRGLDDSGETDAPLRVKIQSYLDTAGV
jgi:DNA-binding SARP family transcriptional activator/tetratricopeptide (TPR) repeat protein